MTQLAKEWLRKLYTTEIDECLETASNERLWALGSNSPDQVKMHEINYEEIMGYVNILQKLREEII